MKARYPSATLGRSDAVAATLEGFTPGGEYVLRADAPGLDEITISVDDEGAATSALTVGSAVEAGTHVVSAVSPGGTTIAVVELRVTAAGGSGGSDDRDDDGRGADDDGLATTGGQSLLGWAGMAIVLVLAGLGAVTIRRRVRD